MSKPIKRKPYTLVESLGSTNRHLSTKRFTGWTIKHTGRYRQVWKALCGVVCVRVRGQFNDRDDCQSCRKIMEQNA